MSIEITKSYRAYKKSPYKSIKHSSYFPVYDRLFSPYIGKEITFVEIGILGGGSLFMWREFFGQNARIIGIELNPEAKRWEEEGFEIYIGSQSDPKFWEHFKNEIGDIDIVLDDGGHTFEQQIITVENILPNIKDNGLIVVEDTHTSYMREFGGPSSYSFVEYAKNIVDGINFRFGKFSKKRHEKKIYSVTFLESFVVFNINSELSAIESHPTNNEGIDLNIAHADFGTTALLEKLPKLFKWIKKVPILRTVLVGFYEIIMKTTIITYNFEKNISQRSLRKYFKY